MTKKVEFWRQEIEPNGLLLMHWQPDIYDWGLLFTSRYEVVVKAGNCCR